MGVTITAERLAIGYPGREVGAGIDLSASAGDVFCLLGPNGSGKTTLFKTLLGLLPAKAGRVLIDGQPLARFDRREIAQRIAYVPQAQQVPFAFTVLDLVLMGRTAHLGMFAQPGERDLVAAHAALARLDIGELAQRDVTRLSGGQRQLVLIARALAQGAPVLIMDEPTASLDFGNQARVLSVVAALATDGLSVILSTHDPDHALAIGTQVALLHEGRLRATGAPQQVLDGETLSAVYGVRVSVERLPDGRRVCLPALARR
ncbi:MAG: ABC transporter ATP-binding protein [Burkholderiaceae bacterium]